MKAVCTLRNSAYFNRLLVLLLFMLPAVVQAQFTFTTNNGAITITKYTGLGGAVTIPSTTNGWLVTGIGSYAFYYCSSLTSVTIPNTVTSIGDGAFCYCPSLASVTIPNSVTNVAGQAFRDCARLTSVTIGNHVIGIGDYAFYNCTNLASVTIPNTVTSIGGQAFYSCTSLKMVLFLGNAPGAGIDTSVFQNDSNAIVYYLPGTTNWGPTFDARPTVLWNPQAQKDNSFGVQSNLFGFNLTGSSNLVLVVEGSTDLVNWSP